MASQDWPWTASLIEVRQSARLIAECCTLLLMRPPIICAQDGRVGKVVWIYFHDCEFKSLEFHSEAPGLLLGIDTMGGAFLFQLGTLPVCCFQIVFPVGDQYGVSERSERVQRVIRLLQTIVSSAYRSLFCAMILRSSATAIRLCNVCQAVELWASISANSMKYFQWGCWRREVDCLADTPTRNFDDDKMDKRNVLHICR